MSIPAQGAVGAETMTAGQSLDLRDLHAANIARQAEWCPDQVPDLSFRGNELGGECGEAQNVIKKLERERQGWRGSRATKDDLADELADVVICADHCAVTADIDLGAAVRRKFNATSEKQGLSVFLPPPALASPRADSDERTAGEDLRAILLRAKWIGQQTTSEDFAARAVFETREEAHEAYRALVALRDAATPAQPARPLPDSLRALLEDAFNRGFDLAEGNWHEGTEWFTWAKEKRAKEIEDILASHPAGQSAGSGADLTEPHAVFLAMHAGKIAKPTLDRLMQIYGADTLRTHLARLGPETDLAVTARSRGEWGLKGGHDTEGTSKLLIEIADRLSSAPDSTRTGQVGLREALARSLTKSVAGGSPDRYRIEIACPDLATMQVLRDGLVSLRDNPAAITAPHDDGFTADELREIRAAIMELGAGAIRTQKITDHQAAEDLQRHCIGRIERALASRLAARPAAPETQGADISQAAVDVLAERRRQVEAEGWKPEHDDTHRKGEMARAAGCYALLAGGIDPPMAKAWPWDRCWWKPAGPRRMLVKAAALILAEIERRDRAALPDFSGKEG